MRPHHRLRPVPSQPPYPSHHGRRVTWDGWKHSPQVSCVPEDACQGCSSLANPYLARGTIHPLPGEMVPDPDAHPVRQRRTPRAVPATPDRALVAFACPDCQRVDVYLMGDAFGALDHLHTS